MNKYRNYRANGFDSKAEERRWYELSLMEKAGEIKALQRQVKYELIPAQKIDKKVVERAVTYVADFVYYTPDGQLVVEDVKGMKTTDYIIKRKLMLWIHGIRITET